MSSATPPPRKAELSRETGETRVRAAVDLDRPAPPAIETGLGFLDHMLTAVAVHGRIGLELSCTGDLHVDDHHTAEDCALTLGTAIDQALGDRGGIERFGEASIPMDEALARCAIDLSGRPASAISLGLRRERLGDVACENLHHVFQSLAQTMRAAVHIDVVRGVNDHHRAEAAFKAFAVALRRAVARTGHASIPSTKGVL
ncbi:MAG: imidazoleglycerol-phosphate dehydratase HisB [Planctomycetota bacterium]